VTIQHTPIYSLPYPQESDSADVPRDIQALALRLDAVIPASGGTPPDLSGYQPTSAKGQPNGYASLDASGKVPTAQLPVTDLSGYQQTSQKGQVNGYASLDGTGKVPIAQLPTSAMSGGDPAWTNLSLASGWANANSAYGVARYRKTAAGVVMVEGFLSWVGGGADPGGVSTISQLPAGYRPITIIITQNIAAGNIYGTSCRIDVASDGVLSYIQGDNVNNFLNMHFQFFAEQ